MNHWLKGKKKLVALSLVGLSCGPTAMDGPEEELSATASPLTVEDKLKTLRLLQQDERVKSRELQLAIEPRLQVFLDQATKKNVLFSLQKYQPANKWIPTIKSSISADDLTLKNARTTVEQRVGAHQLSLKYLAAELQKQRVAALPEATSVNTSGAYSLHVMVADYSWSLSRRLPTLHTEIPTLHDDPRCVGDLIIDASLDRYLRATLDESDDKALAALRAFQQQLSCLSRRQLNALEEAMVEQVEPSLNHLLGTTAAPTFRGKFRELMAAPILLVADQTRAFSRSKPGLFWLAKNQADLVRAAKLRGSLLQRAGLYVLDPRLHELVIISSKAQRATKDQPSAAKTALLASKDTRGLWSVNLLPAFLESITSPCFGADLVLEGTGLSGERLKCDVGCGAAKTDAAQLGKGLTTAVSGSALAAKKCPATPGGTGSGTGSSGSGPAGAAGVTVGSSGSRSSCVLAAVMNDRADTTGRIVSCLSELHAGSGGGGSPSVGLSGGQSCGPNVAQGDPNPDELDDGWDDEGERTVQMCDAVTRACEKFTERQEEDGSVTTTDEDGNVVGNVPPGEASPVDPGTTGPSGGGSGSTGGGTGSTGGGTGATGGGSGTTGGGSGATGGGAGGGGGTDTSEQDELDAQGNPHNDNGEDQCGVNPQCRETAVGQCDPAEGSCSGGCTGNDVGTAFTQCTSTLPGRTTQQPIGHVSPNLIYPAPDTTSGSGMGDLLACTAGGTPSINTCAQQAVALCTADKPNCMCGKAAPAISPGLLTQDLCQSMQCAGAASAGGEALMSGPSGISDCGCGSVYGG